MGFIKDEREGDARTFDRSVHWRGQCKQTRTGANKTNRIFSPCFQLTRTPLIQIEKKSLPLALYSRAHFTTSFDERLFKFILLSTMVN